LKVCASIAAKNEFYSFWLASVQIETFRFDFPAFGNTQNVVAKSAPLLSPQRSRGLHPLLVPPLRGLRTTS
jgi:hypothetical protein